jgi:butyrate kinase
METPMNKRTIVNIEEMIKKANYSTNNDELKELAKNPNMNIRRAVAKNRNTPSEIIDELVYDAVANVSVVASKHPRCSTKREFDSHTLTNRCVICEKSEERALYECKDCLA